MLFNKEEVMKFIPHRDPFLFIDEVDSIVLGDWSYGDKILGAQDAIGGEVVAKYHVSKDLPVFKGHFPGRPIFPGVLQVEMMAQTSSFVVAFFHPDPFGEKTLDVALASVSGAKFRKPILPESDLIIKAKMVRYRKPMIVNECCIYIGDQLISEATVTASVRY